jgi:hypothetical protein
MKKNIKDMTENEFFESNYKSLVKKFFEFHKYGEYAPSARVVNDFINQITYIVLMFIRSTYELNEGLKLADYENFKDIFVDALKESLDKSELKRIN